MESGPVVRFLCALPQSAFAQHAAATRSLSPEAAPRPATTAGTSARRIAWYGLGTLLLGLLAVSPLHAQTATVGNTVPLGGGFSRPMAWRWTGAATSMSPKRQRGEGDSRRLRFLQLRDDARRRLPLSHRRGGGWERQRLCGRLRQPRGEEDSLQLYFFLLRDDAGRRLRYPRALRWTRAATSMSPNTNNAVKRCPRD